MPEPVYSLLPVALSVGYDTGLETARDRKPLRGALRGSLKGLYAGTGGVTVHHLLASLLQPRLGMFGSGLAAAGGVGAWYLLRKLLDQVLAEEQRPGRPQRFQPTMRNVYALPADNPRAFTRTVLYEG